MSVKFAKQRTVFLLPLGNDILANVIKWRDSLIAAGFKGTDPLFPQIDNSFRQDNLLEQAIKKMGIKSDVTIRTIFKQAFEAAGLPYITPHSFRKTLARHAANQSPAFLNAVRQNLGHESIDTTLNSYGYVSATEQQKILAGMTLD